MDCRYAEALSRRYRVHFGEVVNGFICDNWCNACEYLAMKLQVLGCAGGIGGRERLTTCLLVDDDVLLDAGTGLTTLDMDQLVKIEHIFLSHSHLDHIAGMALLADAVLGKRVGPVTIHATEKVIATLKSHFFNWQIWPDFTTIPTVEDPVLRWEPLQTGVPIELQGRTIIANPVHHTVDAVSYFVHKGTAGFLFTGDMSTTTSLWEKMKTESALSKVIIDCSFTNADAELAALSGHYCPQSLLEDIQAMPMAVQFLIYHLKPGQEDMIMQELRAGANGRSFEALKCGDQFIFDENA